MTPANNKQTCVIIGASHAGINCAFSLRKDGWEGNIILYDGDPEFPYHRPPLSKAYLTSEPHTPQSLLFPKENYIDDDITLKLGHRVNAIDRKEQNITLEDGTTQAYDKLVIATGARPFIPPIQGIETAKNCFAMRTALDAVNIREAFNQTAKKRVVVIGGGYIGLETAASLKKLGAQVTVIERENRVLARVTTPEMSAFFTELHQKNGVHILTSKTVITVENKGDYNVVTCDDNTTLEADIIVVGVGIIVNTELALEAGLTIKNGIQVDASMKTNDPNIYAIGDCSFHYNPHYKTNVRLESVQNAVDQAKTAAQAICGDASIIYDSIPWFWSDQFDIKLQMVGLSTGYTDMVIRKEASENSFSVWYFKDLTLLAVDAVNFAKAYILGTRFIKSGQILDKTKIEDASTPFKPNNFLKNEN
ncbi:FAD-dependent oxidoreductase [Tamlana agarivorans]|uniref:FAD-dependent oxidoreductase n=1 Tax=Pseudotamlana agarivorans TaxID=481183 RepID=A0ACC5U943_9FLAO|nr:FAD-dependent oxidoreductase [Tamlana agarivorans]MBU2950848.1 FAD-dependent oxidoreductase [Tamlana agarivorans]